MGRAQELFTKPDPPKDVSDSTKEDFTLKNQKSPLYYTLNPNPS